MPAVTTIPHGSVGIMDGFCGRFEADCNEPNPIQIGEELSEI